MTGYDPEWTDRNASWWVKADRARVHLLSVREQVAAYRDRGPYTLTPEPTDDPDVTAYRLRFHHPIPNELLATIGDVLSNLRAALDNLAYAVAAAEHGGTVPARFERLTRFPITEDVAAFDDFFRGRRAGLYAGRAQEAFRRTQHWAWMEQAEDLGVVLGQSTGDHFMWDPLNRLDVLWNIDKHRRVATVAWIPNEQDVWWGSVGSTQREMLPGDGTRADGSILFRMRGRDDGQGDKVFEHFNIGVRDDPPFQANDSSLPDVTDVLAEFYRAAVDVAFLQVFQVMSQP